MLNITVRHTIQCSLLVVLTAPMTLAEDASIDFRRDIKPLFTKHCGSCHGVDKQEGGLRLDHGATALRGGDSGPLLEPKQREKSELWSRITSDDESLKMPPPYEENIHPLSAEDIAAIGRWIDAGAVWPDDGKKLVVKTDHWAYQPLQKTAVNDLPTSAWVQNDIDRIIFGRGQRSCC